MTVKRSARCDLESTLATRRWLDLPFSTGMTFTSMKGNQRPARLCDAWLLTDPQKTSEACLDNTTVRALSKPKCAAQERQ
jgi:hypothetical protein